jgi:hypothetical protein
VGVRGWGKRLEASGLDWTTNDGRRMSGPIGSSAGTTPGHRHDPEDGASPMHATRLPHPTADSARTPRGLIPIGSRIAVGSRTLSR